jgi:hypothetical protein
MLSYLKARLLQRRGLVSLLTILVSTGILTAEDTPTQRSNNARTGTTHQTGFNQSLLGSGHGWGLRGLLRVTGSIYAQPLL